MSVMRKWKVREVALCEGRHDVAGPNGVIEDFIYHNIEKPNDFRQLQETANHWLDTMHDFESIHLYVTGLSQALTCFLARWTTRNLEMLSAGSVPIPLTVFHWNRDTESYDSHTFPLR